MEELRERLSQCVAAVFPDLTPQEIPVASVASVSNWDSMATVTLHTLVQEEFGIEIDPDDLEQFVSYELILAYLQEAGVGR